MEHALADIPRFYTALAEWGACLVYILILRRRYGGVRIVATVIAGLVALLATQWFAALLPIALWIPGMLLAIVVMYVFLLASLKASLLTVGYLVARAIVLAEFAASLHWQLESFFLGHSPDSWWCFPLLLGSYAGIFVLAWLAEVRHLPRNDVLEVGWRDLVTAGAIAITTFGISNLSFLNANTPFSARLGMEISYIRTLVDLCGFVVLYAHQEQRREVELRVQNEAMASLLRNQHEQYLHTRRSIDEVNRKYHDMKHHIEALRSVQDPGLKDRYLNELEDSISGYGTQVRTGNGVLDTVLTAKHMYAQEHRIELSCVADGHLLDAMSVMDICTIAGNALDNAIESAMRVPDENERLIRIALFAQDDFVMMRIENTYDGTLHRHNDRIMTRKPDRGQHGYGLRNIEATAEKYGGSTSIEADETWFSLRILLPRVQS